MAGHRLLIVEDDDSTREALREYYSRKGWHVSEAGTVDEALPLLETEPEPCCLILDLMLPDGEGLAVLKRLRFKGLVTRVVVCTGTVDLARLKAAAELRPDAMLPKPIVLPDSWSAECRVCQVQAHET
jgi:DNA-binding response OmpR family regulator